MVLKDYKGIRFNGHTIVKAYYNNQIVFSLNNEEKDSVIGGFWNNTSLWNNEDLFKN